LGHGLFVGGCVQGSYDDWVGPMDNSELIVQLQPGENIKFSIFSHRSVDFLRAKVATGFSVS